MQNWKTTLAGLVAICGVLGPFLTLLGKGDYSGALSQIPVIITGIGLILAKDFNAKL